MFLSLRSDEASGKWKRLPKFKNSDAAIQKCRSKTALTMLVWRIWISSVFPLVWEIVLKFILVFSKPARSSERRSSSDLQEEKVVALCREHLLFIRLPTFYTHFLEWCVCLFVCDVLSSLCTGNFFAIGRFLQTEKTPNYTCPNCIKAQRSHLHRP